MEITDVRVILVENSTKPELKAFVSVVLDSSFIIKDIKVIKKDDKTFLSMPSKKLPDGKFMDVVHPLNVEMRVKFEKAIFKKYNELKKEEK